MIIDDADIARASRDLDVELEKIFQEAQGVLGDDADLGEILGEAEDAPREDAEKLPPAEILADDEDLPEAEIIDDDAALRVNLTRDELAAIIEKSVERGIMSALKKLGKI